MVFRIHFFYFENRENFTIEILKTPQHFNLPFFNIDFSHPRHQLCKGVTKTAPKCLKMAKVLEM